MAVSENMLQSAGCPNLYGAGTNDLCRGEILFYQGNHKTAEPLLQKALMQAEGEGPFETVCKALFYLLKLTLFQGNLRKSVQIMLELEKKLETENHPSYSHYYDIALAWYFYALRQPELFPSWLKEDFTSYHNACFIENLGNQLKARYCFLTKNVPALLTYINVMKQQEAILYGRIEILILEACVLYQEKKKTAAYHALQNAYEISFPNGIFMPFIELGRDMQILAADAKNNASCQVPAVWLELIRRKAAVFGKHQKLMIAEYEKSCRYFSGNQSSGRGSKAAGQGGIYAHNTRRQE